jgi:hypothetical protein
MEGGVSPHRDDGGAGCKAGAPSPWGGFRHGTALPIHVGRRKPTYFLYLILKMTNVILDQKFFSAINIAALNEYNEGLDEADVLTADDAVLSGTAASIISTVRSGVPDVCSSGFSAGGSF